MKAGYLTELDAAKALAKWMCLDTNRPRPGPPTPAPLAAHATNSFQANDSDSNNDGYNQDIDMDSYVSTVGGSIASHHMGATVIVVTLNPTLPCFLHLHLVENPMFPWQTLSRSLLSPTQPPLVCSFPPPVRPTICGQIIMPSPRIGHCLPVMSPLWTILTRHPEHCIHQDPHGWTRHW
jgi:hypothetical protein